MKSGKIVAVFKEEGQKESRVILDFEKNGVMVHVEGEGECMSLSLARLFAHCFQAHVKRFAAEKGAVLRAFPVKKSGRA